MDVKREMLMTIDPSDGTWCYLYCTCGLCFQIPFFCGTTPLSGPGPLHYRGFPITPRHTTLGRTSLDELSARRRDLYMTKHNTHKRQTSMHPAEFEPAISASERPQTNVLDVADTGNSSSIT